MKTKFAVLVVIGILLTSCTAQTATQEIKDAPEEHATQAPSMQEPIVTEEFVTFVSTETPTEAPTEPPLACVTLLAPENGVDLSITGKVTFSWTPIDEAGSYVLNFILPSGATVSFETDQTSRDRFMEAFTPGGQYQWQVIVRGAGGSDICVSEVFTFSKPAYEQPQKPKGDGNDDGNGNGDNNGGGSDGCTDPFGCGGEQ